MRFANEQNLTRDIGENTFFRDAAKNIANSLRAAAQKRHVYANNLNLQTTREDLLNYFANRGFLV